MVGRDTIAVLDCIKQFAEQDIAPSAPAWSMGMEPDPSLFVKAAKLGLTGIEVPVEMGGLGFGFGFKARVVKTLAAVDFGFAMAVINTANVARRLARSASDSVREHYLPRLLNEGECACTAMTEVNAGSDFAAIKTRAERVDGGWILNGEKKWVVNARRASLALVYAQCEMTGNREGVGAFLVPLDGQGCNRFSIDSPYQQTSIGLGGFSMENCRVPEGHCVLPPGKAFREIMVEINGARVCVAAMCDAMLRTSLDDVAAYGRVRETFGRLLVDHQAWRLLLARAETDAAAVSCLVDKSISVIESDDGSDGKHAAQLIAAQAKIFAVETCRRHLPILLHAMGAEGLDPTRPLIRHVAAAHLAGLADGSTEMLLERVAKTVGQSKPKL